MDFNLDYKKIQNLFGFRKQYSVFLVLVMRTMCLMNTVSLSVLSASMGYSEQKSGYQRLRRLLSNITFCREALAKAIVSLTGSDLHPKWVVIFDRTYWMFGKRHLNFLYMSICAGSICIPLFCKLLGPDKKGNSSFCERKDLLDVFIKCFGKEKIQYFLGDREFIGEEWLSYLKLNSIPFAQRIREKGQLIANKDGKLIKSQLFFQTLKTNEFLFLKNRKIGMKGNIYLDVAALKNAENELVVLVYHNVENPLNAYLQRWNIEICFRNLKSSGFNIEESHVTEPKRIVCLLNIVSLVFALTVKLGTLLEFKKTRKIKKHGYKEKGLIKFTLDILKDFILKSFKSMLHHQQTIFPKKILKFVG